MKIGPRKLELLNKIGAVDDKLLAFYDSKPKMHLEKLTMKDLKRLLEAFSAVYEIFAKCSDKKGDENESND